MSEAPLVAGAQPGEVGHDDPLFGRIALHYKLITREQLDEVVAAQEREGGVRRLGDLLVERGYLDARQLEQLLVAQREYVARRRTQAAVPAPQAATAAPAAGRGGQLDRVLAYAVSRGASDIHVHSGAALQLRLHGSLIDLDPTVLTPEVAERLIREVLRPEEAGRLAQSGQVDFAYTLPGIGRFRANAYRQQRGVDAVFRAIPPAPPTLSALGLPTTLARFANLHQGMVLLTGPAGCGKSATLAALLNLVNEERSDHIITIEDPIECVHPSKRCVVNQRQVGRHTGSFARALRAALREDPDVIAIGELRDLETVSLALTAAETGHLVLATLHTSSAVRTVNRILGIFPASQQDQVRTMVSESLRAVVSQRLVVRADGRGRVPALEVMVVNKAVGNLIRENKTYQIKSQLQTGSTFGMCLLDGSLAELVRTRVITRDEALRHCDDPLRIPVPTVPAATLETRDAGEPA